MELIWQREYFTFDVSTFLNLSFVFPGFSSESSLGVHYLIHLGITFSCPLCHKKLAKKQSLLEHIRFHQGQRRFVCSICGKSFITGSSLNRHAKMHGSSLPLTQPTSTCDQCLRGFEDQQTFVHHLRAHKVMNSHQALPNSDPSSIQPMSCRFCDTIWGSALGLSRHIKSVHSSLLAQPPPPSSSPFVEPSTSTAGENIEVIDLTDDDEQPKVDGTAESGMVVPEMEIPPISGVSKVNLDGEEVDAIEVVTTVVEGESPMEAENFTDLLVQVESFAAASPPEEDELRKLKGKEQSTVRTLTSSSTSRTKTSKYSNSDTTIFKNLSDTSDNEHVNPTAVYARVLQNAYFSLASQLRCTPVRLTVSRHCTDTFIFIVCNTFF